MATHRFHGYDTGSGHQGVCEGGLACVAGRNCTTYQSRVVVQQAAGNKPVGSVQTTCAQGARGRGARGDGLAKSASKAGNCTGADSRTVVHVSDHGHIPDVVLEVHQRPDLLDRELHL